MADFFYWTRTSDEGFSHLSVYLKNPANNNPGWYFANPGTYKVTQKDRAGTFFRRMPVKFGIHHGSAGPEVAHQPTKMGKPGEFLVERSGGGLQIITEHEYNLRFSGNSSRIPGQKQAESSITIQTGPTGSAPTTSTPSMGSY